MKKRQTEESNERILLYPDLPAKPAILLVLVTDARRDVSMKSMFWYPVATLARKKRSPAAKRMQLFNPNCALFRLHIPY